MARYADIDFCKDPGAICSRSEHPELKWIAGMFYWISSLQPYDNGWNYLDELKLFVDHGMKDDAFIDAVSGIVNRGKSERNVSCFPAPLSFQYKKLKVFVLLLRLSQPTLRHGSIRWWRRKERKLQEGARCVF